MSDTYLKPTLDIFTSNRVIKGHAFSLDSQHETATTMRLIVITQAGNFPFNHDLHNTKAFVFCSAKSKEKDRVIKNYFPLQKLQGEWVQAFGATISGIASVVALTTIDQS